MGRDEYLFGPRISRSAREPRDALRVAAAAAKKIYAGRVRNAALEARKSARASPSPPAYVPGRCSAMRSCRKSRNAHTAWREMESRAREILSRTFRIAAAGCPRY